MISFALPYGFDFGKLRKVDVAGRRMVVTLENVQDAQGNLAVSNIPGEEQSFGMVQHTVHFLPVDPDHTCVKVSSYSCQVST